MPIQSVVNTTEILHNSRPKRNRRQCLRGVYAKIRVACITDALYEPSEANAAFCAKRETRRGEKNKAPAFRLFPNVPEIKEKQKKCLNLLLKRKDVLGLLPTRLEKSLIY